MPIDPIRIAEEIKRTYALNLVGSNPTAFKSILRRFGDPTLPIEEKLPDLVKMRGPYLQALSIPSWSDNRWAEFGSGLKARYARDGLTPEIIATFDELGFERLYSFQEDAIHSILSNKNTLIVAGTGRGKTESWMIPLFHYIISRKRGLIQDETPAVGVKALLIYPTKALAQDQLKRLINYLFRLNRRLEPQARITVGIYDGDTPSRVSTDLRTYLFSAFKHFRCPIYDEELEKCTGCTRALVPTFSDEPGQPLVLNLPNPICRDEVDLDFIELTREDVIERHPDIIITNPDMLNIRLLNINEDQQRVALIEEPKFIILDEVHTYTELFGTFTAFILKRYRQVRAHALRHTRPSDQVADNLRLIAASATVANKEELFTQLGGLSTKRMNVVEEKAVGLPNKRVQSIPSILLQHPFESKELETSIQRLFHGREILEPVRELFSLFSITEETCPPAATPEELVDVVGEEMFARLTSRDKGAEHLQILRYLHQKLVQSPMIPSELQGHLKSRFAELLGRKLSDEEASTLIHNFSVLGTLSGVLERRVHLFTWPLDGFYTCLNCRAVYSQPQQQCKRCGGEFITKFVLCNDCGEETLESWFCPLCRQLYPLIATVDGENVYYQGYACSCTGESQPTIRVLWRPYYRCTSCNHTTQIVTSPTCVQCDSLLVVTGSSLTCSNPACGRKYAIPEELGCPVCGDELTYSSTVSKCCGVCSTPEHAGELSCSRGGRSIPFTTLPWVCSDPACGHITFGEEAPPVCGCGRRLHGLAALFDLNSAQYCEECHQYFLPGHTCGKGHKLSLQPRDYRSFVLVDSQWRIRNASDIRGAVPCYHPHRDYSKIRRYETLMRSPSNVAVTASQYALRAIVNHSEHWSKMMERAKMLSFSDSHSDMEELGRDFNEPEERVFLDQLIVDVLTAGPQTLKEVAGAVVQRIEEYGRSLNRNTDASVKDFNWLRLFGGDKQVEEEVTKRFLPGFYASGKSYRPALVSEGIADIRLKTIPLTQQEAVLAHVVRMNGMRRSTIGEMVKERVPAFNQVLEQLVEQGTLKLDMQKDTVHFCPEALICSLVSSEHGIAWNPSSQRFYSSLEGQVGRRPDNLDLFDVEFRTRADFGHPNFSRVAFRIAFSRPLIFRSEVYKGDVEKSKRREIEYAFKYGNHVHFLSTGPTMEMGIDIGDLDLLLLFGTPPNVNAYLQRVGRGGRRSKRSLVVSVSKRNPIDYYYYRRPQELIRSEPQPVPLYIHNEEVMRICLTWALLDFVAVSYWVPWHSQNTPLGMTVSDGQDFQPLIQPKPVDLLSYTRLVYGLKNKETDYGYPLKALDVIVHDRRDDASSYLRALLDYPVCRTCGAQGETVGENCPVDACQGTLVGAHVVYADLVEDVLDSFSEHVVDFVVRFRDDLEDALAALNLERADVTRQLRRVSRRQIDDHQQLQARKESLASRARSIDQLLERLAEMSYTDVQRFTSESKYAYQIRTISDTVQVRGHTLNYQKQHVVRTEPAREMNMALKEYHPYAIKLRGGEKYVTCRVAYDDWKTTTLLQALDEANLPYRTYFCPSCSQEYQSFEENGQCRCGGKLEPASVKVLKQVDTYPLNFVIGPDPDNPGKWRTVQQAFRFGDQEEPESTYTTIENRLARFTSTQSFLLTTESGAKLGDLTLGRIHLVSFAHYTTVSYRSGLREPVPQLFEICGVTGCGGILMKGQTGKYCALDPSHGTGQHQVVRPAYLFETEGLRLRLDVGGAALTHTLAHGLRLGLEKVGGVLVRSIGELIEDGTVYLYDSIPGGSGVTRLLTRAQSEGFVHFRDALGTMRLTLSECKCDDGCPHCLYQYGCFLWNSPQTLSRKSLLTLLDDGIKLVSKKAWKLSQAPQLDENTVGWPEEEEATRLDAWSHICDLETTFRQLIELRYEAEHGSHWAKAISPNLRAEWEAHMTGDGEESLLAYSHLGQLTDLVLAEWVLFQDLFGTDREDKMNFRGKMESIVRTRNSLAHSRSVHEAELRETIIYCDDLLGKL